MKLSADEIYQKAIQLRKQLEILIDELKSRAQAGDSEAAGTLRDLRKALGGIDKR